eukprot:TRINITY_DN19015_c0_g1_i1.p1 TRINITY_DN19015_c0_g1~~TRINITY_DN19015_c0_g1_i1.p1  ORF type:complete len:213 (+),score=33.76 TRINITY_DN19015_c0_g1_i1:67-705(+)
MDRLKVIALVVGIVSMMVWMFQVVALADDKGYVEWNSRCGSGMMLNSCGDKSLRESSCKEVADHAKAAAAFGVLTILLLSVTWITHTLLAVPVINKMLMARNGFKQFTMNHLWILHLVASLFLFITWCTLTGLYYREFCGEKIKDLATLQHGFAFLIINNVVEVALAVTCLRGLHIGASANAGEKTPPSTPPPADERGHTPQKAYGNPLAYD